MSEYKTEQEAFWAGEFGNNYISRNEDEKLVNSNTILFSNILKHAPNLNSIAEFGCNIGLNLRAIKRFAPQIDLTGFEINEQAAAIARDEGVATIDVRSIIEPMSTGLTYDLTFTKGVLIHINPDFLPVVYQNLYDLSNRYILVGEYYNPSPVSIPYRGHEDRLFKRDFAGDLISKFNLKLVDYGFVYHGDNYAPQDDVTWFLMEK